MRPPEVFVRALDPEEASRLKAISRRARYQSKRARAMILLASHTGMPAPKIAELVRTDDSHVRKVIHAFNERGFDSLDPDYRGGRPKKATPAERDKVIATARTRPDSQGAPLTRWSLRKLALDLRNEEIELSPEALRQVLGAAGLSHQRTRSWKRSPDPLFEERAERVLALYREPPADGPVACFDEMGSIQLIPQHGSGWAERKRPERHRATYNKRGGVRYLYGAYDVHADRFHGRLRPRKGAREVIAFFSQIRMRYDPRLRIYLVQDNLSCHWTKEVRGWAEDANMELVPTPTYASYLNRIECHFWVLGEFVVKNSDFESWGQVAKAMADHIGYRNRERQAPELIAAVRKAMVG